MRHIVIAADESDCARSAATWACSTLVHKDDQVSLIAVLPALDPVAAGLAVPDAFTSVAAAAASLEDQLEVQRRRLTKLMEDLIGHLDPLCEAQLQAHVLPAGGGASGVAESICAYAKKVKADLVVVGSRGMGAVKSTVMSVVGLGSVSDYLLHHLSITTCVVHGTGLQVGPKEMRKVLVAVEDSEHSKKAERWAIENVLGPNDQLHLVAVALPVPYVAGIQTPLHTTAVSPAPAGDLEGEYRAALEGAQCAAAQAADRAFNLEIAGDDAAAAHVLEREEDDESFKDARDWAKKESQEAADRAATEYKVDKSRIFFRALEPEGGAQDVGESIRHYAEENKVDVAVFGSREMGAVKRAVLSFLGMGSVSDWAAHHLTCPVIIVKHGEAVKSEKKD